MTDRIDPTQPDPVHRMSVRVYWEDTDAGGIVYHAGHIRFFERGRTEYLRARGIEQSKMMTDEKAVFFAVRRIEIDYLKTAGLDDLLTVETSTRDIGGVRIVLDQRLMREDETIATAVVTVVTLGRDGRPHRVPAEIRRRFAPGA
jgi:acyl-CoA thioester hydrolase